MKNKEYTSFNFYQETAELMLEFDNKTIGKFFRALVEEQVLGKSEVQFDVAEKVAYSFIKRSMEEGVREI